MRERLEYLESPTAPLHGESYSRLTRENIEAQRRELPWRRDEGAIGDEARRAVERELDLEEARL